jgi:hypothetical protein
MDLYAECRNIECVCVYIYIYIYMCVCVCVCVLYFPISVQRSLLPNVLTIPQSTFNNYKSYIIFIY